MRDGRTAATTLEEGVLSSCHQVDSRQPCACNPPKSCYGVSGVTSEGCKEWGATYGPGSLYAGAFLWEQLLTVRGPRKDLQAPVEVSVLLREARSARRCHPPAFTEFSMSPESQHGNSNYAQGTRGQNKPESPAGHKSLAKMRQHKN